MRWKGGRVVDGDGLENRYPLHADRGFESHPFRHDSTELTVTVPFY